MCAVPFIREGRCWFRFATTEKKMYRVCIFCGHRAWSRHQRKCPELAKENPVWIGQLMIPKPTDYLRRAKELELQAGTGVIGKGALEWQLRQEAKTLAPVG